MSTYAVLLRDCKKPDLISLADAMESSLELSHADARTRAADCQGIVAQDLDQTNAALLRRELTARGIESLALAMNRIHEFPHAVPAVSLSVDGAMLTVRDLIDAMHVIDGDHVLLLSAGTVVTSSTERKSEIANPLTVHYGYMLGKTAAFPLDLVRTTFSEKSTTCQWLEIYTCGPGGKESALQHFRIDAKRFNYACLGGRKSVSSTLNFADVARLIAEGCRHAFLDPGMEDLVQFCSLSHTSYPSGSHFTRHNDWLLQLILNGFAPQTESGERGASLQSVSTGRL